MGLVTKILVSSCIQRIVLQRLLLIVCKESLHNGKQNEGNYAIPLYL